jgi:hypothetical protein
VRQIISKAVVIGEQKVSARGAAREGAWRPQLDRAAGVASHQRLVGVEQARVASLRHNRLADEPAPAIGVVDRVRVFALLHGSCVNLLEFDEALVVPPPLRQSSRLS